MDTDNFECGFFIAHSECVGFFVMHKDANGMYSVPQPCEPRPSHASALRDLRDFEQSRRIASTNSNYSDIETAKENFIKGYIEASQSDDTNVKSSAHRAWDKMFGP